MTTAARTVLYMDFDGTIAFTGDAAGYHARSGGLIDVRTNPQPLNLAAARTIRWSGELVTGLGDLDADWVWLSAWFEVAQRELDPLLHIASHGSLTWQADIDQYGKWAALVQDQTRNPRPFIWADDAATIFYDPTELPTWVPHLVLTPDTATGLTRAHLEQAQAFLTAYGL